MPKQRKKTEVDFGDEEVVLADVAKARYDGNSHETDSGLVYWRVN